MEGDLAVYGPMIIVRLFVLIIFAGAFGKGCENLAEKRYYWAGLWCGLAVASGAALADYASS